jgi:NADH dehydrogenase
MKVLVAGGTGFIGRVLCRVLARRGHDVTAAGRAPPATMGRIDTATLDVTDSDLIDTVAGHDAVVNLVALPSHLNPTGQSHDAVTRQGTQNLISASEATGVDRFVQMSALGVDSDVETAYFAAKRSAERIVRNAELEWVIYRPSVVFGDGCAFLPFLRRLSTARVVPLPGGGQMRIQPIWVDDLGAMLADGGEDDRHTGETYELGGPDVFTLAETTVLLRPNTVILPLPMTVSAVGASIAEWLPGLPIGRDQHRVQTLDNTVRTNDVSAFGVDERDLHSLYEYLQA